MLFVNTTHQRRGRRKHLIDKDEDRLFGRQLDALADYVHELADSEVCGDEVFLLIDGCDVGFLDLFANNLRLVRRKSLQMSREEGIPGCGQHISGGYARLRPCASRRGARL